jgi:cytochrome P450
MTPENLPGLPLTRPADPLVPPPEYAGLRAEQPISRISIWDGGLTPWLVTRYEDARAILASPAFSSDPTPRPCMPPFPSFREGEFEPEPGFFIAQDPPVHDFMRQLLTREFMIRRINALRPGIEALTAELLDGMEQQGAPLDLVEHFSLPLPSLVICNLLGVPYEDHDFFQRRTKILVDTRSEPELLEATADELREFLEKLVDRKRMEPGDDVLSRLGAYANDGTITARDAVNLGIFLLIAGHETTANMTALSTIALIRNPDQLPRLQAGPAEAANAVEELLRYLTIVHVGLRRYATEDFAVGGVTIRAGEGVIIALGAANYDGGIFPGADQLDLARPNARQHVAFGFGIHQCLGQPLARAELQIALPALFERFPRLRLAVPLEEIPFKKAALVYGVEKLPVVW